MPIVIGILLAVALGLAVLMTPEVAFARNEANNKRLVKFTLAGEPERQRVQEDPQVLWQTAQANAGFAFSFDAFLLATMASSEYNGYGQSGNVSQQLKAAVMHVALNERKRRKSTLVKMLIPDGKLGSQRGRYADTRLAPRMYDVLIARAVLNGQIKDPTGGAVQFDSPRAQDALAKARDDYKTADEIAAERIAGGRKVVYLPGEDPRTVRFWV